MGLQSISLTPARSRGIYMPAVWWARPPQTTSPFPSWLPPFPRAQQRPIGIWLKRFLRHPFPPINRAWQRKKPMNVKSPANPVGDGSSGVKVNRDSLPSEDGRKQGRDVPSYLSWNLRITCTRDLFACTAGMEKTEHILS